MPATRVERYRLPTCQGPATAVRAYGSHWWLVTPWGARPFSGSDSAAFAELRRLCWEGEAGAEHNTITRAIEQARRDNGPETVSCPRKAALCPSYGNDVPTTARDPQGTSMLRSSSHAQ